MTRDNENPVYFSFFDSNEAEQWTKSTDVSMEWSGGFEVRLLRPFCCCQYAGEVVYWGIFPGMQESNLYSWERPGNLKCTYDFGDLDYNNGVRTDDLNEWFDDARRHRLRRSFQFHNVEVNLVQGPFFGTACGDPCGVYGAGYGGGSCAGVGAGCGSPCYGVPSWSSYLNVGWMCGFRYFRFDEGLEFASADSSDQFGVVPRDDMYYTIDVDNHLIGCQLGFQADYAWRQRLHWIAATKFGLYANHINHYSRIIGNRGPAYVGGIGPNAGMLFDVPSSKTDVAFLGELDLGLGWHITPRLQASVGYRVVAVTGVALATNQIPYNFAGIQDVADVDSNGSLILHGGYAGAEYCW